MQSQSHFTRKSEMTEPDIEGGKSTIDRTNADQILFKIRNSRSFSLEDRERLDLINAKWAAVCRNEDDLLVEADFMRAHPEILHNGEHRQELLSSLRIMADRAREVFDFAIKIPAELGDALQNAALSALEPIHRSQLLTNEASATRMSKSFRAESDAIKRVGDIAATDIPNALKFADIDWRAFVEDETTNQSVDFRTVVMVPSQELRIDIKIPEFFVLVDGQPFDALVTQMADKAGIVFDGIPPILAYLSVTLEDGSVVVNFRTAELEEKEPT